MPEERTGPGLLAGIAGGLPIVGGIIQSALGYRGQRKTNEANMELAKYQYSKDLEMWNRGNVYNSPQAQMQRLKEAGLNPNLVYGTGAVGNASGQLPKYNAPTVDYNYVPPVAESLSTTFSNFQNFRIQQAQIDNLREQNRIKKAEADYAVAYYGSRASGTRSGALVKGIDARQKSAEEIARLDLDTTEDPIELFRMLDSSGNPQTFNLPNQYAKKIVEYDLGARKAGIDQKNVNIARMNKDIALKDKQLEYFLVNLFGPYATKLVGLLLGGKGMKMGTPGKAGTTQGQNKATPPWRGSIKTNPVAPATRGTRNRVRPRN